ncbi:MAG: 2-oxoacid:acceptor oxidoreductase family protein [Victivallaceae bacterium]|nr:2-oxoacid:acceptor oxidoreductase family protein [Victivallaceae bacterium]
MSCNKTFNVIMAGLGGQGVVKATDILAEVMFRQGYDIKKSEVHGMSRRGGAVQSEVRFGADVKSPMVPYGECDILAVLDDTQTEVVLGKLRAGGTLIVPDDVPTDKLNTPKALNIMVLGAVSRHLEMAGQELWEKVISESFPEKLREGNIAMFRLGRGE